MRLRSVCLFSFTAGVFAAGCSPGASVGDAGPTYPVRGRVLFEGEPISGARVVFHARPAERLQCNPFAVTGPDGAFEVSTYSLNDGSPAGDFAVTISWAPALNPGSSEPEEGRERLPRKYQNPDDSGISVTVAANENQLVAFELKK